MTVGVCDEEPLALGADHTCELNNGCYYLTCVTTNHPARDDTMLLQIQMQSVCALFCQVVSAQTQTEKQLKIHPTFTFCTYD